MFNNYPLKIKYISNGTGKKDLFGYANAEPIDANARYVGGKTVETNEQNSYRVEHRQVYHVSFEVKTDDELEINGVKHKVKQVEQVCDVFGRTVFWEVQVI